jgi:hypothetical protein
MTTLAQDNFAQDVASRYGAASVTASDPAVELATGHVLIEADGGHYAVVVDEVGEIVLDVVAASRRATASARAA